MHFKQLARFGGKSHGRPDFKREKQNKKSESFFPLNFNVYIDLERTWKELEREINNNGDQFRWKKNLKII